MNYWKQNTHTTHPTQHHPEVHSNCLFNFTVSCQINRTYSHSSAQVHELKVSCIQKNIHLSNMLKHLFPFHFFALITEGITKSGSLPTKKEAATHFARAYSHGFRLLHDSLLLSCMYIMQTPFEHSPAISLVNKKNLVLHHSSKTSLLKKKKKASWQCYSQRCATICDEVSGVEWQMTWPLTKKERNTQQKH